MTEQRVPWETIVVTMGLLLIYTELVRLREVINLISGQVTRAEVERQVLLERQMGILSVVQNAPAGQMTTAQGGGANVGGAQSLAGDVAQRV